MKVFKEFVPVLDGLHPRFIAFCEHHGLEPGYVLTNQIKDLFAAPGESRSRYQNWDQISGTVSIIFIMGITSN